MKKIIISAKARNGVIGKGGDLPWHSKEEFRHFKDTTYGFPIIMGRKTFEALGKPLKGREHIIITRQPHLMIPFDQVKVVSSLQEAFGYCEKRDYESVFVIGGGEIYKQAINIVDELIISIMKFDAEGDVYFPEINPHIWKETSRVDRDEFEIIKYSRI